MGTPEIVVGDNIRDGAEALHEKHGQAEVVAEAGDQPYVFIDLGPVALDEYDYDQDEARVILRIHKDFPNGQHYGLVTVPLLTVDGNQPDNTTVNHDHAQALREVGIDEDYLYWSRDWRELTVSKPEHMARATALVRGTLRNPFNN
ncbi:hypothetical protein [Halorarius halobius]|uniref:hypothetical protein n=1 Tax=Halorarius halobius TaxID=2962671 RepID=UPI0020CBEDAD|nr:hypothetical protein [Halorarius halobius]